MIKDKTIFLTSFFSHLKLFIKNSKNAPSENHEKEEAVPFNMLGNPFAPTGKIDRKSVFDRESASSIKIPKRLIIHNTSETLPITLSFFMQI
jgi:hypothetical protein